MENLSMRRVEALADLVQACRESGVKISKALAVDHGFCVIFEGWESKCAALTDTTLYNRKLYWQTKGFPWDNGSVTIHSASGLVLLLKNYKKD